MGIQLIVGLGNPGPQYKNSRHNCGFMVLERLSLRWGIPLRLKSEFRGNYGEGSVAGSKLRLLLPETFMNLSGQSVRAVVDWYKLDPEQVLVVYDDMDLPLGKLRLRGNGTAGGHNGIKSMIQHLGTDKIPRLRVGVGHPRQQEKSKEVVQHVLGSFTPTEKPCLEKVLEASADAVDMVLQKDLATAMNRFNALDIGSESIPKL